MPMLEKVRQDDIQRRTMRFRVIDHEPLEGAWGYGSVRRQFAPWMLDISYSREQDGSAAHPPANWDVAAGWEVSVNVSGPIILKAGNLGQQTATRSYYDSAEMPDWVRAAVEENHPAAKTPRGSEQ